MKRKWLSWDIEVAAIVPEDGDWAEYRPYGITCAAVAWVDPDNNVQAKVWTARGDRMDAPELCSMLGYLEGAVLSGCTIFTWNGLGFDFDVLAEELTCGCSPRAAKLAASEDHVDGMLHVLCKRGFPVGLQKTAEGLGIEGKLDGMTGADAPRLWIEGHRQQVLAYVQRDAELQLQVALEIEEQGDFIWVTRAGKRSYFALDKWWSVPEALAQPVPDTSWMGDDGPDWSRSKFSGWLEQYGVTA